MDKLPPNAVYQEIPLLSVDEVKEILESSSNNSKKYYAIISLAWHGTDFEEAQRICKEYANDQDQELRIAAIESIGHISRVYGKIDLDTFLPILQGALKSKNKEVVGVAEDALSDIEIFVNPKKVDD